MTSDNFDTILNSLRLKQPFQVFTVELQGGKRFEVDHSSAIVIRDGVIGTPPGARKTAWFDHDSVLRIIGAHSGVDA